MIMKSECSCQQCILGHGECAFQLRVVLVSTIEKGLCIRILLICRPQKSDHGVICGNYYQIDAGKLPEVRDQD